MIIYTAPLIMALAAYLSLGIGDTIVTAYAFRHYGQQVRELNPIIRIIIRETGFWGVWAFKSILQIGFYGFLLFVPYEGQVIVLSLLNASGITIIGSNLYQIHILRKAGASHE